MITKWNIEILQLNIENSIQAIKNEKKKNQKYQAKYSLKLIITQSLLKKQT